MGKNKEINYVGQPVLKQIFKLVDNIKLQGIIDKHQSDRYYKAFKTRTHLLTMLFGIFSRCDSLTEIAEGMRALAGKLEYFGLNKSPAKSTISDGFYATGQTKYLRKYTSFWSSDTNHFYRTAVLLA